MVDETFSQSGAVGSEKRLSTSQRYVGDSCFLVPLLREFLNVSDSSTQAARLANSLAVKKCTL